MLVKETKTIVKLMENGNIRLSEDGFLLGEMSKEVFETHYKSKLKGTPVYLDEKKATRLTA
ncbi:hypothetical protein EHQ26_03210 [Leptospira bourretii]|uniref:Uncharacterized protein n=1 Tax=Leptospira bourretii TaxID=2484962 RepID=A0ABY2LKI9_9LEPT|nr:hypothetical protein EHQ26_03210 [Leptospira bourretii]TGL16845.1 hypothetical protein EHQ42_10985 [Leptospira levettii]TGL38823.1 hypothetical protein EHQ45_04435 [Leptospira bourretii]